MITTFAIMVLCFWICSGYFSLQRYYFLPKREIEFSINNVKLGGRGVDEKKDEKNVKKFCRFKKVPYLCIPFPQGKERDH